MRKFGISNPSDIIGPQDLDLGSGWAGDFLVQKWAPEKHDYVEEMVTHEISWDLCKGKGLYGTQEAFVQAHFPRSLTRKTFHSPPLQRKDVAPGPLVGPLWPQSLGPLGPRGSLGPLSPLGPLGSLGPFWGLLRPSRGPCGPRGAFSGTQPGDRLGE